MREPLFLFLLLGAFLCSHGQKNCFDSSACNYYPVGDPDIDLCCYGICGCTDPLACNYDYKADCSAEMCDYYSCNNCDTFLANDEPSNAKYLADSVWYSSTLCCSSTSMFNPCSPENTIYDQWFYFNSDTLDTFILDVQMAEGFLGGVTLFGLEVNALTLDSTFVAIACASQSSNYSINIGDFYYAAPDFDFMPFTNFYFSIWTDDPEQCGGFELMISGRTYGCGTDTSPNYIWWADLENGTCQYPDPVGDFCEGAFELNCGEIFEGSNSLTSSHGTPIGLESCEYRPGNGTWHKFTGTGDAHVLSTCGSFIDTKINVYSLPIGDDCGLANYTCVQYQLDAGSELCGADNSEDNFIEFTSEIGLEYYVYVGYENSPDPYSGGSYQLELQCQILGCTGDFDQDGVVAAADLLTFLSVFGCDENCENDLNNDGSINAGDLLIFLAVYGEQCN